MPILTQQMMNEKYLLEARDQCLNLRIVHRPNSLIISKLFLLAFQSCNFEPIPIQLELVESAAQIVNGQTPCVLVLGAEYEFQVVGAGRRLGGGNGREVVVEIGELGYWGGWRGKGGSDGVRENIGGLNLGGCLRHGELIW